MMKGCDEMKKTIIIFIAFMVLAAVPFLIGCVSDKSQATKAAENSMDSAGIEGYKVDGNAKEITTEDSQSHQMIIKMRLLQEGMSPNLEDYRDAYLVDMKNNDGNTITVVVVNEDGKMKAILPENIKK